MSESRKLLIGFGLLAVVCVCAIGITLLAARQLGTQIVDSTSAGPTAVAKAQKNIAEFDVPAGFQPVAVSLFGYDMVTLVDETPGVGMQIMLMQYRFMSGDTQQMEERMRESAQRQSNYPGASMHVVDVYDKTIRGKQTTVTVSEGGMQGVRIRQLMTVFQGNQGPAILMIQGPVDFWNDQLVENFIKSIR